MRLKIGNGYILKNGEACLAEEDRGTYMMLRKLTEVPGYHHNYDGTYGTDRRFKQLNVVQEVSISFDYPPIPVRNMDYSACLEGCEEDGVYGRGPTREAAMLDLIDQLEE